MNLIHTKYMDSIAKDSYSMRYGMSFTLKLFIIHFDKNICFALFTDVYQDLMHATFYNPYHDYSWIWYHIMSTEGEIIGIDMDI